MSRRVRDGVLNKNSLELVRGSFADVGDVAMSLKFSESGASS